MELYILHFVKIFFSYYSISVALPLVLWHCWLGNRKDIRPVKNWVLIRWWWRFDWSFVCLIASVVTRVANSVTAQTRRPLPYPSPVPLPLFPFLPLPPLPPSFPLPPLPLEVGPLKPARGSGEHCKFPSGVWGRAPAEIEFGSF